MYKVHHIWNQTNDYSSDVAGTNGVITLVSSEMNEFVLPGTWYEYAISICKPGDNFNKKIGRQLAKTRLVNKTEPFYGCFRYDGPKRYYDIKLMMLLSIMANNNMVLQEWAYHTIKLSYHYDMTQSFVDLYRY